jgi:hypothetical protein
MRGESVPSNPQTSPALWPRSIFRADAVRRYIQNQHKTVLPRLVCPHTFLYVWILLVLLFLAGGLVFSLIEARTLEATVFPGVRL